jgi:K+-transporting ATPase c subunit
MALKKKPLVFTILAVAIIVLLVPSARGASGSFIVKAGREETRILSLADQDHVQIRVTVIGQTVNAMSFFISDPSGITMENFGATGSVNYAFVCSQAGNYTLHFSNVASTEDKFVSLEYDVTSYIFGMPETLFLVLIIAGVGVVALLVFVSMSKHP